MAIIFIGDGALLTHAIRFCLSSGFSVEKALVPSLSFSQAALHSLNVSVEEFKDIQQLHEVLSLYDAKSVVFSINNQFILDDRLLCSGPKFFNIHNGLVQHYRGVAEVCVIAAICHRDSKYGATIQQLLPQQMVDSGPVVAQIQFDVSPNDSFHDLMRISLDNCKKIFEENFVAIATHQYSVKLVDVAKKSYRYSDVKPLIIDADLEPRLRAVDLGRFAGFFPRLSGIISSLT